jgi:hypothetical protein
VYDILFVATSIAGLAVLGYRFDVLFPDFLVFHAAAQAALEGKLSVIYDTAALTDLQNKLYAARLPYEIGFRPFLYPPPWLLDLPPFGAGLASFLALAEGLCTVALRAVALSWRAILAILVAPAAAWVVLAGQNTFLSAALLYGGFALLERRPWWLACLWGCWPTSRKSGCWCRLRCSPPAPGGG